jgi:hypothetical protein
MRACGGAGSAGESARERTEQKKRAGRFGMKCPGPRKLSPGEREGGRERNCEVRASEVSALALFPMLEVQSVPANS